jgi:hypothetical protein
MCSTGALIAGQQAVLVCLFAAVQRLSVTSFIMFGTSQLQQSAGATQAVCITCLPCFTFLCWVQFKRVVSGVG